MANSLNNKPFGARDANEKNDRDLSDVVDVGDLMPSFSFDNDPTRVRVIVGRKGTGKTHALRLLQLESRRLRNEIVARNIDNDLAQDRVVRSLFAQSGSGVGVANWERIWRCALAVAALSRFTCRQPDQGAKSALESAETDAATIRDEWTAYAFESLNTLDPFGALLFMLDRRRNAESLSFLVMDPALEELEVFISGLMRHCEPTHFFIDGFDEYEDKVPSLWLQIQLGLFWLAFRANVTRQRLRRVYLTVAVRDGVLAAAQRSTQADRFDYGGNIMVLTWSREAATLFFRETLWRVRAKPFWRADRKWIESSPETGWIGLTTVKPVGRRPEPLVDYLVRHSRCTPRDLIDIGNAVAAKFNQASEPSRRPFPLLSSAVGAASQGIAELAIRAAAQELIRDPAFPVEQSQGADEQIAAGVIRYLEDILLQIVAGSADEILPGEEFKEIVENTVRSNLPGDNGDGHCEAVTSALWRNGAIAMKSNRRNHVGWRYVWSDISRPDMQVPTDRAWIGFHPSMFEIAKIARSTRGPVF